LRVLFHACCGPCFVRVGPILREEGNDVTAFFYNPNVQPYKEFEARRGALHEVCEEEGLEVIEDSRYDPEAWLRAALDADNRCEACYRDRIERTARRAKADGFDAFTTTLLASPYQDHGLAKRLGELVAEEVGVPFLYRDLREHWRESRARTFELGIYRQRYCGCIFSERDRYIGAPEESGKRRDAQD
jgi:predicted adenine nucleotide alpha hydrolase (AANH) superfamily ATPase